MAKEKYGHDVIVAVYNHIKDNPYATYEEIEQSLLPQKVNANSVVKRLQRMGCIRVERITDSATGRITGSAKVCVKSP